MCVCVCVCVCVHAEADGDVLVGIDLAIGLHGSHHLVDGRRLVVGHIGNHRQDGAGIVEQAGGGGDRRRGGDELLGRRRQFTPFEAAFGTDRLEAAGCEGQAVHRHDPRHAAHIEREPVHVIHDVRINAGVARGFKDDDQHIRRHAESCRDIGRVLIIF